MGLLDLPAPLFDFIEREVLSAVPSTARIVFWAVLGSTLSLLIYRLLSPQTSIARTKLQAAAARRRLNGHDGDFAAALPLMRTSLALSLRQIWLVLPATLIGALPVLSLLVWLDTAYGHALPPPANAPSLDVSPPGYGAHWSDYDKGGRIEIQDRNGRFVVDLVVDAPVPEIEKRHWWNVLVANPAGYLPASGPVERVEIAWPEQRYVPIGPAWAQSWLTLFLSVAFLVSLIVVRIAGIA